MEISSNRRITTTNHPTLSSTLISSSNPLTATTHNTHNAAVGVVRKSIANNPNHHDSSNHVSIHNPRNSGSNTSTSTLTLYIHPPTEDITLSDIEELGYNRLQLLKYIENIKANSKQSSSSNNPNGNISLIDQQEFHQLLNKYHMNQIRSDYVSHFLLRLAFCKNEELRSWYATHETLLFKQRFEASSEDEVGVILSESGLEYKIYSGNDLFNSSAALEDIARKLQIMPHFSMLGSYIQLRFEDAWELLRGRQCIVSDGYAWITRQQLSKVMATKFKLHLKSQLAQTHRALQNIKPDQRIQPLINALSKQYVGSQYKSIRVTGSVTRDQLPALVERGSFPLCMQNLFKQLQIDSHLKHGGRMQFSLFLKGIGLSMEESLTFWRMMFSRKVQGDKFDRQYAYNIRHNYGKEGKRTDYSPWSCVKIINSQPGAGDHHGCPFKYSDEQQLRNRMRERKIKSEQIDEVITLVRDKHYQVACKKYFTLTHNQYDNENVGNHPNAYFDASMKYYAAKENLMSGNVKQEVKKESTAKTSSTTTNHTAGGADTVPMKVEEESKTQDEPMST